MKIFLNLTVMFCLGMFLYQYYLHPEETHKLIFWSMLTLFNYQSSIKLNQNKDD